MWTGFNSRTVLWAAGPWLAHVIRFTVTLACAAWTVFGTNGWLNSSYNCTTVIGITSTPFDLDVAIFTPRGSPRIFDQPIVQPIQSSPTNCKNWMRWGPRGVTTKDRWNIVWWWRISKVSMKSKVFTLSSHQKLQICNPWILHLLP